MFHSGLKHYPNSPSHRPSSFYSLVVAFIILIFLCTSHSTPHGGSHLCHMIYHYTCVLYRQAKLLCVYVCVLYGQAKLLCAYVCVLYGQAKLLCVYVCVLYGQAKLLCVCVCVCVCPLWTSQVTVCVCVCPLWTGQVTVFVCVSSMDRPSYCVYNDIRIMQVVPRYISKEIVQLHGSLLVQLSMV